MNTTYFKVDYHYSLERAFEQKKKLEDAGLRNVIIVSVVADTRMIHWVCVQQKNFI